MSSDGPGSRDTPDALARLAAVLAEAAHGVPPTPRELAELLWLARHMGPGPGADDTREAPAPAREDPDRAPAPAAVDAPARKRPPREQAPPDSAPGPPARVPVRLPAHRPSPAPADGPPGASLLAPAPPMLRHPLALQRALRVLRRRVDAPVGRELDERATADRIARLGADPDHWLPVLRPARERWLSLNLVYDAGPTMPVWRPLIRELHTALAQSGAFRTVTLCRADADGTLRGAEGRIPADGRTVTLLISDCMGPQWRQGPAGTRWYATLHRWARRMPLAVVQPLPEHLWRESALPAAPGLLSAPHPVAPTAALAFTPYEEPEFGRPEGAVPLPVLEPEPSWLAHWAGVLTTPGGTRFPAAAAWLGGPLPASAQDRTDIGRLSAEELVLRFRATASPEAFRLAGHLAVGRPDLPVMRLVQAAVEKDPRPGHLAEVVLSGLLTALPGAPPGSYAFREGVRELLLLGLPHGERGRTVELLDRMGEFIDELAGVARGDFWVRIPSERGTPTPVEREVVATLSAESVRRLAPGAGAGLFAGRYRLTRKSRAGDRGWVAEDTREGNAPVVVCRYAPDEPVVPFTELCRGLGAVDHPGIARVLDHGFADGTPYLVREFVAGPTLDECLADDANRPSRDELRALLREIGDTALAVRFGEEPRGEVTSRSIVLSPNGPVLTCLDSAPIVQESASEVLETLAAIMLDQYPGTPFEPTRPRQPAGAVRPGPDTGILFTTDDLAGRPEVRITLEAAVHEILSRSLPYDRFRVDVRPDGYRVRTASDAYLLPVLVAVLRELPHALAGLARPARLRVAFGPVSVSPAAAATGVDVVVPPALYDEFAASSAARDARPFEPLYRDDDPEAPPAAWYCRLGPEPREGGERELVRGPFITRDLRELGVPTPGRTAIVHTRADGPLTVFDPIQPYGSLPPRAETYYTVDLTVQQARHTLSLPSAGKAAFTAVAELAWQVTDPVAFVRAGVAGVSALLLEHLRATAAAITRRHPARRAGSAQRAVDEAVRDWPVPGLAVSCRVRLGPEGAQGSAPAAAPPPAALLTRAECVLVGFDGPLARLFTVQGARAAVLDLLNVVADHRAPGDALAGRPLPTVTGAFPHPLDLLRAFAREPVGPLLRDRLDELELAAVPDAPMTHLSLALVRALHRSGRRVSVVSDVSSRAVHRGLAPHKLPLAGVHARRKDLGLLTPDPDSLRRALEHLDVPAHTAVLLGSSVAELTAAQRLGLPFVGFAPTAPGQRRLREGGGAAVVSSLEPLLEAIRTG
ncbi:SAV_2336 N-terminal domain-related protein [Streptomyces sp. F-1]|uniref:SAV_2336 N-terminal domain-related protein n=1 Tax=Streptomyces sp. F-1 TaxID=463642 RepID=UPI00085C0024|nr:SAV_2336 N-terminal domain-related protein [Streptomyces sp. F-1]SFY51840.1 Serine/threonine-protein kinase PknA [Streptomyces sp. F-1]